MQLFSAIPEKAWRNSLFSMIFVFLRSCFGSVLCARLDVPGYGWSNPAVRLVLRGRNMKEDRPEGVDSQDLDTQPTITTVFRLLQDMNGRMRAMEGKLQDMDGKLQDMDGKLQNVDGNLQQIDAKLQNMDARLNSLDETMQTGFDRLNDRIDQLQSHGEADYEKLLRRIRGIERRVP